MHLDLCSFQSIHIDCTFALKTNQTGASSSETIFLLGASPVLHNTANMNSEHFKCTFVDLCNLYAMHIDRTISAFPITANMDFCNLLPSAQCTIACESSHIIDSHSLRHTFPEAQNRKRTKCGPAIYSFAGSPMCTISPLSWWCSYGVIHRSLWCKCVQFTEAECLVQMCNAQTSLVQMCNAQTSLLQMFNAQTSLVKMCNSQKRSA